MSPIKALAASLLLFATPSLARPANVIPIAWAAPSLERIAENGLQKSDVAITIYAARGESESFQVGVTAHAQSLSAVTIVPSDFRNDRYTIDRANITIYREHYILVSEEHAFHAIDDGTPLTNPSLGRGRYPDVLLPMTAAGFDVTSGLTQPVWVDVSVPRAAAAGTYTATLTVTGKEGPANFESVVTVTLVVWNFVLPARPALQSLFPSRKAPGVQRAAIEREIFKHRLMPRAPFATPECDLIDAGLNISSVPFWGAKDNNGVVELDPPPTVDMFKAAAQEHQCEVTLYCYPIDEISGRIDLYNRLKAWAVNMHAAGIQNLVTITPDPALYNESSSSARSAVDIWVVLPFQYDRWADRCRAVQQKGDQVWSYNAVAQDNFSPKWHLDFPPIDFRIQPGFISQSLGLTGLLYWSVDRWGPQPLTDAMGEFAPGDGLLVYPNADNSGVYPSMRLKWLRDGVDDFDYVDLLKKAGRGDFALAISRNIAPDWRGWTRDAKTLEAARIRLGEALSALK